MIRQRVVAIKTADVAEPLVATTNNDDHDFVVLRRARSYFLWFTFIMTTAFLGILIGAVATSLLNGLPTISDFMATMIRVLVSVAVFMLFHILVRTYLWARFASAAHVFEPHKYTNYFIFAREKLSFFSSLSLFFYVFQVGFLMMITIVPVTVYPFQHYVLAGMGIGFSLANETTLLARRWYVHYGIYDRYLTEQAKDEHPQSVKKQAERRKELLRQHFGYTNYWVLLIINLFLLIGAYTCALVFGSYVTFVPSLDPSQFTAYALSEYLLFYLVCLLPSMHVMDIYMPLKMVSQSAVV
jgi:hypothetical protein